MRRAARNPTDASARMTAVSPPPRALATRAIWAPCATTARRGARCRTAIVRPSGSRSVARRCKYSFNPVPGISLVITLGAAAVIDHGPLAVGPIPLPPPVTCPARPPPVEPTDWKPMLAALRRFVAREAPARPARSLRPGLLGANPAFRTLQGRRPAGRQSRDLLVTARRLWAGGALSQDNRPLDSSGPRQRPSVATPSRASIRINASFTVA